jgi:hypothetical protein
MGKMGVEQRLITEPLTYLKFRELNKKDALQQYYGEVSKSPPPPSNPTGSHREPSSVD